MLFSCYFCVINSLNFWVINQKVFHNSSVMNEVMKSLTVWHFSYEYLQEFLGYESFCFENVLIFLFFTEIFFI